MATLRIKNVPEDVHSSLMATYPNEQKRNVKVLSVISDLINKPKRLKQTMSKQRVIDLLGELQENPCHSQGLSAEEAVRNLRESRVHEV